MPWSPASITTVASESPLIMRLRGGKLALSGGVRPDDVVVLTGRVLDVNGTPIRGVGLEVKQGSEAEAPSNQVVTDANGEFFAFLPAEASGVWTVSYSAIGCPSNVWSDSTCSTYKTGYTGNLEPQTISVTLPQATPLALTWK